MKNEIVSNEKGVTIWSNDALAIRRWIVDASCFNDDGEITIDLSQFSYSIDSKEQTLILTLD